MKTEVQPYYRKDGTFVSGYFRAGHPELLPPDKFMKDYYPRKEEEMRIMIGLINQSPDIDEWKCTTTSKRCIGQDPCYFQEDTDRCPVYKFRITTKKVGVY